MKLLVVLTDFCAVGLQACVDRKCALLKEPRVTLHLKDGPLEQNPMHVTIRIAYSQVVQFKTLQFCAEFLLCGVRQCLVYIQYCDV